MVVVRECLLSCSVAAVLNIFDSVGGGRRSCAGTELEHFTTSGRSGVAVMCVVPVSRCHRKLVFCVVTLSVS